MGEIGFNAGKYFSENGAETIGYDIDKKAVIRARAVMDATDVWEEIPHGEISAYVVCVSTSIKDDKPDMSNIFDACRKISLVAKNRPVVSVTSTVSLGTHRKLSEIFKNSVNLVHVPHRYWKEDPVNHGVKQPRVIGGIDEQALRRGMEFYKKFGIPVTPVPTIELAEMSKIAEQSYRYIQIAFAEELKRICDENGLDFEMLRKACNTKWNTNILEARDGIGGKCLPKDIHYLLDCSKSSLPLIKGAMAADELYKRKRRLT
ncbi:MAG TPA: hypothetical protein ENF64_01850 [Hadesarchaea archaeon]|nr:hypothetical protein [Hadesarchaea archaeon]